MSRNESAAIAGVELVDAISGCIDEIETLLVRRRVVPLRSKDRAVLLSSLRRLERIRAGLSAELDDPNRDLSSLRLWARLAKRSASIVLPIMVTMTGVANLPGAVETVTAAADAAIAWYNEDDRSGDFDRANDQGDTDISMRVIGPELSSWMNSAGLSTDDLAREIGVSWMVLENVVYGVKPVSDGLAGQILAAVEERKELIEEHAGLVERLRVLAAS